MDSGNENGNYYNRVIKGLGFRISGLGFGVWGLGFGI